MREKASQFLSLKQPYEPKSLDVALKIAEVKIIIITIIIIIIFLIIEITLLANSN